jgi:hypothetical protein
MGSRSRSTLPENNRGSSLRNCLISVLESVDGILGPLSTMITSCFLYTARLSRRNAHPAVLEWHYITSSSMQEEIGSLGFYTIPNLSQEPSDARIGCLLVLKGTHECHDPDPEIRYLRFVRQRGIRILKQTRYMWSPQLNSGTRPITSKRQHHAGASREQWVRQSRSAVP